MTVTLVLRALGLGDLLTAVPALRALHTESPHDSLVLAAPAWLDPIARLTGCVDRLVPTAGLGELRWEGTPPDVAVNLHGSGPQSIADLAAIAPHSLITHRHPRFPRIRGPQWRADMHEVTRWCRLLASAGIAADPTRLRIRAPEQSGSAAEIDGHVIVHPGGSSGARRWPADRFAVVADRLRRDGRRIVVTGDAGEVDTAAAVAEAAGLPAESVLAGRLSLSELATVVARADLLISGDTGVGHLATALGTPSVVIFGPNPPAWWGPPSGSVHTALWAGHIGDPHAANPDPGLLSIEPEQVFAAANRRLCGLRPRRGGNAPTFDETKPNPAEGVTMGQKVNPIQIQRYLSGVDYPCNRDGIVRAARSNGADDEVLRALEDMPDRTFNGPNAVSEAVS